MAYSDYLAVKKQKNSIRNSFQNSSQLTKNKEYCTLQNTNQLNEDGDLLQNNRFNISLCNNQKMYSKYNNTLISGFSIMYSIPKIHTPEYIKKRYQPAFCWTCWTPLGEITHSITCSVCEMEYNEEMQPLIDATDSQLLPSLSYLDKFFDDLDIAEENENKCDVVNDFEMAENI